MFLEKQTRSYFIYIEYSVLSKSFHVAKVFRCANRYNLMFCFAGEDDLFI